MSKTSQSEMLAILELAMSEPLGLELRCSDPDRARAALYNARRLVGRPEMSRLQIRLSPWPDRSDLVVCKGPEPASPSPQIGQSLQQLLD